MDKDADAARRKVETRLQGTLEKLKALEVPDEEIVATSLNITSKHRYDEKSDDEIFVGTVVSRELRAGFDTKGKLERFLADIQISESLQVSGVSTALSSEAASYRRDEPAFHAESFQTGHVDFSDRIYAVFLIGD